MKRFKLKLSILVLITTTTLYTSCIESKASETLKEETNVSTTAKSKTNAKPLSEAFKNYWFAGEAEITSYKLEQARYGEMRNGHAVLIYVTEDFLPEAQVKADKQNPENISVLKLNATKKFNTGIYPYSIMQSAFYPLSNNQHAVKVSSSIQEWCGQAYTQLNNKSAFEIMSHSYFEGEADSSFNLNKAILENELWIQLRIDPKSLPTGNIQIIPSFEYTRLKHIAIKPYQATAQLNEGSYKIVYPELERTVTINFNPQSPYDILGWTETFKSGSGEKAKMLTTTATKLASIKSPYWSKKSNKDSILREMLKLE
jgi:hypothetical protein